MALFRIALFISLAVFSTSVRAAEPPQGDNWDSIKLLPDWAGAWGDYDWETGRLRGGEVPNKIPFNAAAQAKVDAYRKLAAAGGDVTYRTQNCIPGGFAGTMGGPEAFLEFLFTPGRVTITSESGLIRRIYTDGRKMPAEPDESFHGYSVGHWEGGTLVVETAGLDRNNDLPANIPAGKGLHVAERIFLTDQDMLQIDSVIEAPATLTAPYRVTKHFLRHRNYTMNEVNCSQNNRDVDKSGRQIFDLTPPDDLPPPPKE